MNETQLKEIIKKGENQEVEFKEKWPSNDTISKVICSLSNTQGGVLIVGVNDKNLIVGLEKQNIDKIQRIISEANHAISPQPIISIENRTIDNKEIVLVTVQKTLDNIYYTYQGAIYIRMGSTSHRLEGTTQLEFLRHRQILSFDESYDNNATVKDIDSVKINKYLEIRGQFNFFKTHTLEDFLLSNKLAIKNKELKIKSAAILLFGKEPTKFYPQIEIKLVQFEGDEAVDILDYKLVEDDLVNAIEQTNNFIKSKISRKLLIKDIKRSDEYQYPLTVVREALVNAITHRDYFSKDSIQISIFKNKLEITSPGGLPNELSKDLFGTISIQRNPILYRFLRDLGFVEGLGTGIPRIKSEMKKAGLLQPEFIFNSNFIRIILINNTTYNSNKNIVQGINKNNKILSIDKENPLDIPITLSNSEIIKEIDIEKLNLNLREEKAINYLKTHKSLQAKQYSIMNKISYATAVNEINHLINLEIIRKVGEFRGAYYVLKKNLSIK